KGFQELVGAGLLEEAPTRIHAAQAEGCAPGSTAIQQGADTITPVRPNSIAKSLAIGNPADGRYAARAGRASGRPNRIRKSVPTANPADARYAGRAVRASGGWATACREEAIQEGMALL